MKKILLLLTCTLYVIHCTIAQSNIGAWQTHNSYSNITQITQSQNKIYGISYGALFSIDKNDHIIETYSKISGLNDNNIHLIEYSDNNDILFIAYKNSNIDLLSEDGSIINNSDLLRKKMSGSKQINNVCFFNNYAYIACDFGITVINLDKNEFYETYIINSDKTNEKTIDIDIIDSNIYALTNSRILIGNISKNLINYQNWESLSCPDSTISNKQIILHNNEILLLKANNILYKYSNKTWQKIKTEIKHISLSNNTLFFTTTQDHLRYITNNQEDIITEYAIDAVCDNNSLWYFTRNMVTVKNLHTEKYNSFQPNGPESNISWQLKYSNGRIFSVPGGRGASNHNTPATLSIYENYDWTLFSHYYFLTHTETAKTSYDLVDIAINPNDNTNYWVASYGLGLYEFRNDELYKFHHCDNSGLNTIFPDRDKFNYIRTDGMTYDDKGNLWIINNAGAIIKYIDPEGKYHDLPYPLNAATPEDIIINNLNTNQKFVLIPRYTESYNSLLFSFNDNGTLDYIGDDQTAYISTVYDQDNKVLSFSGEILLRSIAQDKKGIIWVGTTKGVFLINDPSKVFDNNFKVHRIKIPRNDGTGLADYLLGTEEIKAIAVDGANRKWIGTTSSGVYLVSEDGTEIIHHFTSENSPLLSDAIQSIAINNKTGEVFFGTGNGLISYQSDATEGESVFKNVRAFPNPVRPEYNGVVSITGLTADSQVRITDINGNLIFETISNGGIATWNTCNASGSRVATGTYFAHCISADGKQKHIAKILIIK